MTIGTTTRDVQLLVVDGLDHDLVIGCDVFRDRFEAGIQEGSGQWIRLPGDQRLRYQRIHPNNIICDTPLTEEKICTVSALYDTVIPARSSRTFTAYLPPIGRIEEMPSHGAPAQYGMVEPVGDIADHAAISLARMLTPARQLFHVTMHNYSPRKFKLFAGDPIAQFTPVANNFIVGDEAEKLALLAQQEALKTYMALAVKVLASPAKTSPPATAAAPAVTPATARPDPDRNATDMQARVDLGVDGIAFDERIEIPRNVTEKLQPSQIDPAWPLPEKLADVLNAGACRQQHSRTDSLARRANEDRPDQGYGGQHQPPPPDRQGQDR